MFNRDIFIICCKPHTLHTQYTSQQLILTNVNLIVIEVYFIIIQL